MTDVVLVSDSYDIRYPKEGTCYVWKKGFYGEEHWKGYLFFRLVEGGELIHSIGLGDSQEEAVSSAELERELTLDVYN